MNNINLIIDSSTQTCQHCALPFTFVDENNNIPLDFLLWLGFPVVVGIVVVVGRAVAVIIKYKGITHMFKVSQSASTQYLNKSTSIFVLLTV